MVYLIAPTPVAWKVIDWLEGFSNAIHRPFVQHFAAFAGFQMAQCVARSLGDSWASCHHYDNILAKAIDRR